ncbi:general transcription factor 3C polypeptide 5-like [Haemaphysalis longicornis]
MNEASFNRRQLVLVEYPAVIRSTDRMINSLGGIELISKIYNDPSMALQIKFRPEDPYCKGARAKRVQASAIVLKVKKNRRGPTNHPTVSVEGVISTVYKFVEAADFQFLPMRKNGSGYESLLRTLTPSSLVSTEWLKKDAELFMPPLRFSRAFCRSTKPNNVLDKQVRSLEEIEAIGSTERISDLCERFTAPDKHETSAGWGTHNLEGRLVNSASRIRFQDEEVPHEPKIVAILRLESQSAGRKVKEKIQNLFVRRPLWTRRALQVELQMSFADFMDALATVAYYFIDGPFSSVWVRLGFDPRKEPSTKIYQSLVFRLCEFGTFTPVTPKSTMDECLTCFIPGEVPAFRRMLYHAKDIQLDSVQKLIHANDGSETTCSLKDGWCETGCMLKCRNLMVAALRDMQGSAPPQEEST